ncbi:MAG: PKD domain-containing protein [Candidatus Thorarchaeota archaeon]
MASEIIPGSYTSFTAKVNDPETGLLSGDSIEWDILSDNGIMSVQGATLVNSFTDPGTYTIIVRAIDSVGLNISESFDLEVTQAVYMDEESWFQFIQLRELTATPAVSPVVLVGLGAIAGSLVTIAFVALAIFIRRR